MCLACRTGLDNTAIGEVCRQAGFKVSRQRRGVYRLRGEDKPIAVSIDINLIPAARGFFELMYRQRVKKLISDDEGRQGGQGGEVVMLSRLRYGLFLRVAQSRAYLDEMHLCRRVEIGQYGSGAQDIGHQRAAPGAKLGQTKRRRTPHAVP